MSLLHLLTACLLAARLASGFDGCLSDGFRQTSAAIRCGDTCVSDTCMCGGEEITWKSGKWCCNSAHCDYKRDSNGKTSVMHGRTSATCAGTVLPLTQGCNNGCNHYPGNYTARDWRNNKRAYVAGCKNKTVCLPEHEVCQGRAICDDGSDLQWCRAEERREDVCRVSWTTRCGMSNPGQCVDAKKSHDGHYQCLDRSDQSPFKQITTQNATTRSKLTTNIKNCTENYAKNGFACSGFIPHYGTNCLPWSRWCDIAYGSFVCEELGGHTTTDPELCSDTQFWADQPCGAKNWVRCSGRKNWQCVRPGRDTCEDNSDKISPVMDGTCDKDQFMCMKTINSTKTMSCLDPALRCDQHPQCDAGEDEDDCSEEYKEKGYISEQDTFKCQSKQHNDASQTATVWTWASPCDNVVECWNGEDENNCDSGRIGYYIVGNVQ